MLPYVLFLPRSVSSLPCCWLRWTASKKNDSPHRHWRTAHEKNSMQINARSGSFPSKAWKKWLKNAVIVSSAPTRAYPGIHPVGYPVNCRALFYRDRRIGDAVGYYQGLADLLEKRGVVEDDKWIVCLGWVPARGRP